MKLTQILESILDELNVPRPEDAYKFDKILKKDLGYGTMHTYVFTNVNGDPMEISNMVTKHPKEPGKSIYIAFKKYDPTEPDEEEYDSDEEQEKKYSEKTGAQDFIKVLATVVQATKNTMKKEGGDSSIYAIKFSPADKKRASIYMHYLKTLFPDFEDKGQEGMFTAFVNKNFKKKMVAEIGEATAKPYYYENVEDGENHRIYNFETDSEPPTWYEVSLKELEPVDPFSGEGIKLNINFGTTDEEGNLNLNAVTNKGELYRVMATIVAIVKEDLKNHKYIKTLSFEPSKRKEKDKDSNARGELYKRYIQKAFPNATIGKDMFGSVNVKLK